MSDRIDELLASAIEKVRAGRGSLEAELAACPAEAQAEIEPLLRLALAITPPQASTPSPAFRERLRAQLRQRAVAGAVTKPPLLRMSWWNPFYQRRASMPAFIALLLVLGLVVGGGGVYAAQGSMPGDALYPLRMTLDTLMPSGADVQAMPTAMASPMGTPGPMATQASVNPTGPMGTPGPMFTEMPMGTPGPMATQMPQGPQSMGTQRPHGTPMSGPMMATPMPAQSSGAMSPSGMGSMMPTMTPVSTPMPTMTRMPMATTMATPMPSGPSGPMGTPMMSSPMPSGTPGPMCTPMVSGPMPSSTAGPMPSGTPGPMGTPMMAGPMPSSTSRPMPSATSNPDGHDDMSRGGR